MEYVKFSLLFLGCLSFAGCVTTHAQQPQTVKDSIYEEGYRKGISENIGGMVEKLNGNDFPYIGGTWAEPVVQEVRIPAHIEGGVFYPEHNELVIIAPGEWKRNSAFPIKADQKDFTRAEDKVITADVANLTVMPKDHAPAEPTAKKGE